MSLFDLEDLVRGFVNVVGFFFFLIKWHWWM